MDRKITSVASLAPAPAGWRARIRTVKTGVATITDGAETRTKEAATFAELADALPARPGTKNAPIDVTVALPTRLIVFERLTLPSADREELAGMVRLQLEKSLPYPVEETTNDFQVLSQKETIVPAAQEAGGAEETAEPAAEAAVTVESTVLACVIHNPAVDAFCSPLVQRRQYPRRLTVWAMHVAAQAPSSGVACGLWQEEAEVIFAVFENGILSFAEVISSPDVVLTDLPQVLMSAELAGTPTTFCAVLLDPVLAHLRDSIAEFFGAPSEELRLEALHDANPEQPLVDLTPDSWRRELARMESAHKLRLRLAIAGVAYAAILVLVCAYLFLLQHQLQTVNNELASVRPKVNGILAQQTRWKSLEPAIEPQRYTVEVLYQIFLSLPSPDVRITQFEQSPTDFQVQGEAPDANQAIAMEEKLKAQPGLSQYHLEAANPTILPNDHAQFSISGKL